MTRPTLRLVETAPERPRVDVSSGVDGYTVWLFDREYTTGRTLSNAARIALLLQALDALDALPSTPTHGDRP